MLEVLCYFLINIKAYKLKTCKNNFNSLFNYL
jgi:hypothetical protein